MRWCENEQNSFPDAEFTEVSGVVFHRRPGGQRHPAAAVPRDHGPGRWELPLPDKAPPDEDAP